MPRPRLRHYLRTARLSAGLSQSELGQLLGVSDDVVGKIERDRSVPSLEFAFGCASLFGKSPVELFPGLYQTVDDGIRERASAFGQRLGDADDAASRKKAALLSRYQEISSLAV